jgi:uncharacterized metal-binding protein (TIGR02443 family)
MFDRTKRFIAGAHCPHCKTLDTVVVFSDADGDKRCCVACGIEETLSTLIVDHTTTVISIPATTKKA